MRRAALAAAVVLAAAAASAQAAHGGAGPAAGLSTLGSDIRTWPHGEVRYYNAAPDQEWAVAQATRAWNRSGASVRFVASSPSEAALTIRSVGVCTGDARATIGWRSNATVWVASRDDSRRECNRYAAAGALAHELGHVLGLEHEEGACAAMNSRGNYAGPEQCARPPSWAWRCRLLEAADARGAVALYGGTVSVPTGSPYCPLYRAISPPSPIRVLGGSSGRRLVVGFSRPPAPSLPRFLASSWMAGFAPSLTRGACARRPPQERYGWNVGVGAVQRVEYDGLARGRYCVRVWSFDPLGRPSSRPVTSLVHVSP